MVQNLLQQNFAGHSGKILSALIMAIKNLQELVYARLFIHVVLSSNLETTETQNNHQDDCFDSGATINRIDASEALRKLVGNPLITHGGTVSCLCLYKASYHS